MPRLSYDDEMKAKALEMMEKDGVSETVKALNIKRGTLYRWRNLAKSGEEKTETKPAKRSKGTGNGKSARKPRKAAAKEAPLPLTDSDLDTSADLARLAEENAKLIAENAKLKNALKALLS